MLSQDGIFHLLLMTFKIKILTILLFCFLSVYSQKTLTGIVRSNESNQPIAFTNIFIENTSIGTISNEDGFFELIIPSEYSNSILIFSSLGYKSHRTKISDFSNENKISIKLTEYIEQLEEVTINSRPVLTAYETVKKAFDLYSEKSKTTKYPYIARCFVRHSEKTENEYKWLVEAAIDIYDIGSKKDVRANILETRKSFDNRDIDTLMVLRQYLRDNSSSGFKKRYKKALDYKNQFSKIEIENAFNYYDNHFTNGYNKKLGLMEKILTKNDILRNYNMKNALFTKKNIDDFTFEKDTSYYLNDEKVYKIKFNKFNTKSKTIDVGWIYIQDYNYDIIQINHSVLLAESHHYRRATGKSISSSIEIRYQNNVKGIYPKYLSLKTYKASGYNFSNKLINTLFTNQEILFNEILKDKDSLNNKPDYFEISNSNLFKKTDYNKSFWDNANVLPETEKELNLINDLKRKVNLKIQSQN